LRDTAWVNRILQGDKAAGERLVTENYQRVYGMLRSLTGHREVAEDLTQQTFTRAWQALSGFRGEARISTWLCRIAYHEYTHWRRDRREYASLEDARDVPDLKAVIGLRTVLFSRALELLTEELRETFLLHYEQDLSVKEIALVLDVPTGTVKSRLFTARNRLRELLSDSVADPPPIRPAKVTIVEPAFVTLEEKAL
jgi:RNA polymerase sigma-70 factor (ECF subfamily)